MVPLVGQRAYEAPRTINIPSEGELRSLLASFGYEPRLKGMHELSCDLEKCRIHTQLIDIDELASDYNPKEAVSLFLAGVIDIEMLRLAFPITSMSDEYIYLHLLLSTGKIDSKGIEKTFGVIKELSPEYHEEAYEETAFIMGAFIMQLPRKEIEKHVDGMTLVHYLLMFLAYPNHILAGTPEYQTRFFSLLFKHIGRSSYSYLLEDDNSFFWGYLEKYFGEVSYIKNRLAKKSKKVSTPSQVSGVLDVSKGIGIPTKEQVLEVLIAFGDHPSRLSQVLILREHIQQGDISHKIHSYADFEFQDLRQIALTYVSGRLDTTLLDGESYPLMTTPLPELTAFDKILISSHSTGRDHRKQEQNLYAIYEYLSRNAVNGIDDFGNELIYMIIALLLLKYERNIVNQFDFASLGIEKVMVTLILYPGYLNSAPTSEQVRFFAWFFERYPEQFFIEHTAILEYIEEFFGEIYIVQRFISSVRMKTTELVDIPEEEEIQFRHIALSVEGESYIENQISNIRLLRSTIATGRAESINDVEGVGIVTLGGMYVAGFLPPEIFDGNMLIVGMNGKLHQNPIYFSLLQATKLKKSEKTSICRKCVKFFQEYTESDANMEIEAMMYIILLMKFGKAIVQRHLPEIDFFRRAIPVLLDRGYLDIAPTQEQNDFFSFWFESAGNHSSLESSEGPLWSYLQRYYFDNPIVSAEYKKRFGRKSISKDDSPKITQKIELPKVTPENTRLKEREDGYISLETDIDLPKGVYLHVGVWHKTKGGKLQRPEFFVFETLENIALQIEKGQVVTLGCLASGDTLTAARYRSDNLSFAEIRVEFRKKQQVEDPKPKPKPEPHKEVSPKIEKNDSVETPAIQPDFETLQTGVGIMIDDMDIRVEKNRIIFTLPEGVGVIAQSHCTDVATSREISFDMDYIPEARLVDFMGIPGFVITDEDVLGDFQVRIQEIKEREEERAKMMIHQEAQRLILGLPKLPSIYRDSEQFFRSCERDQLVDIRGDKEYFLWQLAFGETLSRSITSEFKAAGFTIQFTRVAGELKTITIGATQRDDIYAVFNVASSESPETMKVENGGYSVVQIEILRHMLFQAVSRIVYDLYNAPKRKSLKAKIIKKLQDRESVRQETKKKLQAGKASFMHNFKTLEDGKVGTNHPDILKYPIKGRVPYVEISGKVCSDTRRNTNFEEIKEMLSSGELDEIVRNFYGRLLKTKGIGNSGFKILENKKAKEIAKQTEELIVSDDIEDIRQQVLFVLDRFYDAGLSVQLYEAIDFSYRELQD